MEAEGELASFGTEQRSREPKQQPDCISHDQQFYEGDDDQELHKSQDKWANRFHLLVKISNHYSLLS
ncbi:hypothetical protein QYF36_017018 [Acer negundo]|nr:hypothetical protein QYF36_017018 [Acer negundo]